MTNQNPLVVGSIERIAPGAEEAVRGALDLPKPETSIEDAELLLVGWAFGTVVPVIAVELVRDRDEVFMRIGLGQDRPDVAAAFPGQPDARTSGFRALVGTEGLDGLDVLVRAMLANGASAPLARLRLRQADEQKAGERPVLSVVTAAEPPALNASALLPAPAGEYDLSTADALRRFKSSPAMRWAKLIHDDPPPGTAWQRISDNTFFEPLLRQEFTIARDDRVFAIGSCFARGVEGALGRLGIDVESRTAAFDHIPTRAMGFPHDFTNKYNTEAIRNELRWALEPGAAFPGDALLRLPDGDWQDPYATAILESADEETTLERHRLLDRKSTRLNSSHIQKSRMPSSA